MGVDLTQINYKKDPTLEAVDAALVAEKAAEERRGHLGMSQIGHSCDARLWFQFRFCDMAQIDAKGARNIEDGHRGEELMASRLRKVEGVKLWTVDESTGQQFRVSDFGGHFSGSMDGVIKGLLQAPRTPHIWENKESDKFEQFDKLRYADEKSALEKWNMTYFVQAQMYMGYNGLERHYITVNKPGGRASTSARTEFDPKVFARYRERAQKIIESPTPMTRISDRPGWYECTYCPVRSVCHGEELPKPSCRTCMHATPEMGGNARWSCALKKKDLTLAEQVAGCEDHVYIPDIMTNAGFELVDSDALSNHVLYKVGPYYVGNGTPSVEGNHDGKSMEVRPVLPSSSWQHIVPGQLAIEMLKMVFERGAVPVGHDLNVPLEPMPPETKAEQKTGTPKEVMKLLTRKQIDRMLATPGAVGKVQTVKGKKIAFVEGADGRPVA